MKKKINIMTTVTAIIGVTFNLAGCTGYYPTVSNTDESTSSVDSSVVSEDNADSNWIIKYYVDEFNDTTDKMYINYVNLGTFSNTATTDSELLVSVLIDSDSVSFKLYEYGDNLVQNSYSHSVQYDIATKDDSGNKRSLSGSMNSKDGDRIFLTYADGEDLISMLESANTSYIKFHIVNSERESTYYDFTIETSGFKEAYKKLV